MADNYLEYKMEDMRSGRLGQAKKFVPRKRVAAAKQEGEQFKKIASFTIDHTRLEPGIYVSRRDVTPCGDVITTFDVRMTRPNREAAIDPKALHAMEHLVATYLRNDAVWKDRIVYWGPMGCCTGNYLLVSGDYSSEDVMDLVRSAMRFVAGFEGEIPGASARDCGNYTFMDLDGAREAARRYLNEFEAPSFSLQYPDATDKASVH